MKDLQILRRSLRLTPETHQSIEELCRVDGGKVPMSAWIEKAIQEKIARDLTTEVEAEPPQTDVVGRRFYEFFAGGGMARAGLGTNWTCMLANDFDPMKARTYRDNWTNSTDLLVGDINNISVADLPGQAELVWASFPCQDLSLAGNYSGIGTAEDKNQTRSGTFWPFWNLIRGLCNEGRNPALIVLENVYGILTSNGGNDFSAISSVFGEAGYRFGAMVIDARYFVPQSRPRVFIVGVRKDLALPDHLHSENPIEPWHPKKMQEAFRSLPNQLQSSWIWWNPTKPEARKITFADLIDDEPHGVDWDSPEKTKKLLSLMNTNHIKKVEAAKSSGKRTVGGVYKRTRKDDHGNKIQRAEVRFDDLSGCLRTPSGGSSRQHILLVDGDNVRSRLLSSREAARLMGLPETYRLPKNYNDAYHVAGDGVAVPVVRHLAKNILEPLLDANGYRIRRDA